MLRKRILLVAAALMGLSLGTSVSNVNAAAAAGSQQCWYRVGVDPENSCWGCFDACMGAGYLCCDIVVSVDQ
jgi:hypothetical protein